MRQRGSRFKLDHLTMRLALRVGIPIIVLVVFAGWTRDAYAQQGSIVAGRALDQTGAALPGVTIDLVTGATEMNAMTDGTGA